MRNGSTGTAATGARGAQSGTPQLLTVDAVAERLSIPRYAVVAAVRSGDLESVRISERVRRVAPQAVDRFIQARLDSPPVRQVRQVNSNNHGKRGR